MPTNRAEDAVEITHSSEYLFYYYDTQPPKINYLHFGTYRNIPNRVYNKQVNNTGDRVIFPIPECTSSGNLSLSASEECYIEGYLFT